MTERKSTEEQIAAYHTAVDAMGPEDRALLDAIMAARDRFTLRALIRDYYGDFDRAERTPRAVMYLHIGILLGMADQPAHPH